MVRRRQVAMVVECAQTVLLASITVGAYFTLLAGYALTAPLRWGRSAGVGRGQ